MSTALLCSIAGTAYSADPGIVTLPFELRSEGLSADGMGGIYFINSDSLYRMDPEGKARRIDLPKSEKGWRRWDRLSAASHQDGTLWYQSDSTVYRLRKEGGWEEIPFSFPGGRPYQCRMAGIDSLRGHLFCYSDRWRENPASTITASIESFTISDWKALPPMTIEEVVLSGDRFAWIRGNRLTGELGRHPKLSLYSLDPAADREVTMMKTIIGREIEDDMKILPDGNGGVWIWQWPEMAPIYCDTNLQETRFQSEGRVLPAIKGSNHPTEVHTLAQGDSGSPIAIFMQPHPFPYWERRKWERKKFTISLGSLSADTTGRKSVPIPEWWTGPLAGANYRIKVVQSGNGTWLFLGNMIARHDGSTWTLYYSATLPGQLRTARRDRQKASLLSNSRYLALAGLGYAAYQTGPGWAEETGLAMLGFGAGAGAGAMGMLLGLGLCWSGCSGDAQQVLLALSATFLTFPLLGATMAVHWSDDGNMQDRILLPFASSMATSALSATTLYFMSGKHDSKFFFVLPAAGLGAVIGYRLPL